MPKYKVITPIKIDDSHCHECGDIIELTRKEAVSMPWAVEEVISVKEKIIVTEDDDDDVEEVEEDNSEEEDNNPYESMEDDVEDDEKIILSEKKPAPRKRKPKTEK